MYKETLQKRRQESEPTENAVPLLKGANGASAGATYQGQVTSKVNRICEAILEALKNHKDTNLQNIVTAHVCKLPPDLEAGLLLVAALRGKLVKWYVMNASTNYG